MEALVVSLVSVEQWQMFTWLTVQVSVRSDQMEQMRSVK